LQATICPSPRSASLIRDINRVIAKFNALVMLFHKRNAAAMAYQLSPNTSKVVVDVERLYRSPICCELTEAGFLADLDLWLRFVMNHKRLKELLACEYRLFWRDI
jgi:hypothetical protein